MKAGHSSRGLGDTVAQITSWFGIQPCGGCNRRKDWLNRWVPYGSTPDPELPAIQVPSRELHLSESLARSAERGDGPSIEIAYDLPFTLPEERSRDWRELDRIRGPFDREGDGRLQSLAGLSFASHPNPGSHPNLGTHPNLGANIGTSLGTHPSTGAHPSHGAKPTRFVCGVDVTAGMRNAIQTTRTEFGKLDDDKKHDACGALCSLRTGSYAWDIIDLHRQVKADVLNKPWRSICATSGATPACGSSVTVDGSCHFAGSANYVVFGVMCKLCSDHYVGMLAKSSWYELIDKDTYQTMIKQFSKPGMQGLINLYKKFIPALTLDSPAPNIEAAKRWAIAGYDGWPGSAKTPVADRANCLLECAISAPPDFRVSWYPFLNAYSR